MKKKIFAIVLVLCLSFSALSAAGIDLSGDVGIGYMNHMMMTRYNYGDTTLGHIYELAQDKYNALAVGLSLKYSWFYADLAIGFPFKAIPTDSFSTGLKLTNDVKGSLIFDTQLGGGVTLFKETPFNLFIGGALALNYIRTKRNLSDTALRAIELASSGTITANTLASGKEVRSRLMLGAGVNVSASYFFTDHIGICLNLRDSFHFLPLVSHGSYRVRKDNGNIVVVSLKKEGTSQNMKDLIKYSWANNFSVRLGLAFKL